MKLEKYIRAEACSNDNEWLANRRRENAEVLFRYVTLWATFPFWGPGVLLYRWADRLGARLR